MMKLLYRSICSLSSDVRFYTTAVRLTPHIMSAHETIKGPTTNASDQAAAAAIRERAAVSGKTISPDAGEDADLFGKIATEAYNTIPGVEFDGGAFDWGVDNSFKYVLMEVDDPDEEGKCRHLVRGLTWAEYHQDSASPTIEELEAAGLRWRILGGGRIRYSAENKALHIYGHSYGFPWPNGIYKHDVSEAVCRTELCDISVTHSDEGY